QQMRQQRVRSRSSRSGIKPARVSLVYSSSITVERIWRFNAPTLQRFNAPTILTSHTGQFLVGGYVDDFELLGVKRRIGAEGEFAKIALLQFDKQFFVLGAESIEHRRVHYDAKLEVGFVTLSLLQNLREFALNFHAHGERALHFAAAFAIGAIVIN